MEGKSAEPKSKAMNWLTESVVDGYLLVVGSGLMASQP